jgi:hypothetical protein
MADDGDGQLGRVPFRLRLRQLPHRHAPKALCLSPSANPKDAACSGCTPL